MKGLTKWYDGKSFMIKLNKQPDGTPPIEIWRDIWEKNNDAWINNIKIHYQKLKLPFTKKNETEYDNIFSKIVPITLPERKKPALPPNENNQKQYKIELEQLHEDLKNKLRKQPPAFFIKPSENKDPKVAKSIRSMHKKLFEPFKKSYGELLDKYGYSKTSYLKKVKERFGFGIREIRLENKKNPKN